MLKVEGLRAGYGNVNILWDEAFTIGEGEIVAFLGSNGAGKTTTVRAITGMIRPKAGKVVFNGEDLAGKSSREILQHGIVQVPEGTSAVYGNDGSGKPADGRLQQKDAGRFR